jgi:uncharacterized protein YlxP (DUF503 family)
VSATIGAARVTLHFTSTFSLKDKRAEVKRLTARISNQYNCAIAEIEDLDDIRVATLGIAVLSTSANHASQMIATIVERIDRLTQESSVEDVSTELIPM